MIDRNAILAYAQDLGPDIIPVGKVSQDYFAATMANVLSFELAKSSPGKTWADADPFHPAIYRALRLDRDDPAAFYAAFPFRLAKVEDDYCILAAFPPEPIGTDNTWTHLDITHVVAWKPVTGHYNILGDTHPQVIMPDAVEAEATLYGSFFDFARAWAERRAAFYQRRKDQQADKWAHPIAEPRDGNLPGILAIGDPAKIRWPLRQLPDLLTCIGISQQAVNSAIFKQTRLPRVVERKMRAAA